MNGVSHDFVFGRVNFDQLFVLKVVCFPNDEHYS